MSYFNPAIWGDNGKIVNGVQRAYTKAKEDRAPRDTKTRAGYLAFHCTHNTASLDRVVTAAQREYFLETSMYHPLILTQVLTAVPALVEALDPSNPPFKLQPEVDRKKPPAPNDARYIECETMEQYINSQLYMDIGWRELLGPLIQEAKLNGTAFTRLEWYRRAEPQWGINEIKGGDGETVGYEFGAMKAPEVEGLIGRGRVEITEDRARKVLVPHLALYLDPRGRSFRSKHDPQPVRYAIEKWTIAIEQVMTEIMAAPDRGWQYPKDGEWKFLGDLAPLIQADMSRSPLPAGAEIGPTDYRDFEAGLRGWLGTYKGGVADEDDEQRKLQALVDRATGQAVNADEEDEQLVRILSMWTCGPDPWHIMTIGPDGGMTVLRKLKGKDHPCVLFPIPYIAWKPIPVQNEMYGLGLIDILEKIQEEINAYSNLGLTSVKEGISGITLIDRSSGINAKMLAAQPNRVLDIANTVGVPLASLVHYIERPMPNLPALFSQVSAIYEEGNRAGGATEYLQGASPGLAGGTVRGYAMAVQQGGRRWGEEARNLTLQCVEMGEGLQALNIQYVTEARFFQQVGKTGPESAVPISPDMIARKYRFFFNSAPVVVNEQVKLQGITAMATLYGAYAEFNRGKQIYEHARALHLPDPEQYVVVPPQQPPEEEAPVAPGEEAPPQEAVPPEGAPTEGQNVAEGGYPPLPPEVPVGQESAIA